VTILSNNTYLTIFVHISQRAHCFSGIKTNRTVLFRDIIDAYSENRKKFTNALCGKSAGFFNVNAGDTHDYYWRSKVNSLGLQKFTKEIFYS
jgi:hypothetical protein